MVSGCRLIDYSTARPRSPTNHRPSLLPTLHHPSDATGFGDGVAAAQVSCISSLLIAPDRFASRATAKIRRNHPDSPSSMASPSGDSMAAREASDIGKNLTPDSSTKEEKRTDVASSTSCRAACSRFAGARNGSMSPRLSSFPEPQRACDSPVVAVEPGCSERITERIVDDDVTQTDVESVEEVIELQDATGRILEIE